MATPTSPTILTPEKEAVAPPVKGSPFVGFETIMKLLSPNDDVVDLRAAMEALFKHLGVQRWEDMIVFSAKDIVDEIHAAPEPGALKSKLLQKRLGYIVEYAKHAVLDESTTMNTIVHTVQAATTTSTEAADANKSGSLRAAIDKKVVPTLDVFSGEDEDYYSFLDSTMNKLGQAGLARYLTDSQCVDDNKEVAEAVFFALRAAIQGGNARSLATALYDKGIRDPCQLWTDLQKYYDTDINRANVVLFEVKKLLNLRLDPDVTPTTFIADFKECLLRLEKNQAKISTDTDTLRALLLVAIQDDQFETVRDNIVHKPTRDIAEILKDIRERDTSMQMKDGARELTGDGTSTRIRRTGADRGGDRRVSWKDQQSPSWRIPRFPDSWRDAFGPKLFKVMIDWRSQALYKHSSQKTLNDDYALKVESTAPKSPKRSRDRHSRRSKTQQGDVTNPQQSDEEEAGDRNDHDPSRKRIRLQKTRRVVTEKNM